MDVFDRHVTVHDDRLELELKLLNTTLEGPRDVSKDPYLVDPYLERKVKLTQAQFNTGFQTVGTMVIDKAGGSRTFAGRTGMFASPRYAILDTPPPREDGLLVHYKFDGDLTDSVGNRHGSLLNAQSGLGTTGARLGSGYLSIDQTGDANLANVGFQSGGTPLNLGAGPRTIAFFVRAAGVQSPSTRPTFFSIGSPDGTATGRRFDLLFPSATATNRLRVEVNGNGAGGGDLGPIATNLGDGNWHHLAITSAASGTLGSVELFVNGVSVGTVAAGSNPLIDTAASVIVIGDSLATSQTSNPLRGLDGDIDDFRIYDVVLTPAQIQALATATPGNTFADWIAGFDVGGQTGLDDDPDGDGIPNGVENFFGTDPGRFSQGLIAVSSVGNTFTFAHPQGTLASDLTASYRWSTDLTAFHGDGENGDGTTVEISTQPDTPAPGTTTVTAQVTGTAVDKLFVRVEVTQN